MQYLIALAVALLFGMRHLSVARNDCGVLVIKEVSNWFQSPLWVQWCDSGPVRHVAGSAQQKQCCPSVLALK